MDISKILKITATLPSEVTGFRKLAVIESFQTVEDMKDLVSTTQKHLVAATKEGEEKRIMQTVGDNLLNVIDANMDCTHVILFDAE